MKLLIVAALFGAAPYADASDNDTTVPLNGGSIIIRAEFSLKTQLPKLLYSLKNQTSSPWRTLKFEFDIGALCNGEPQQWTVPVTTSLGWAEDHELAVAHSEPVIPLVGKVDGCRAEIVRPRLILAEYRSTRIDGLAIKPIDFGKELQEIKVKRDAEAEEERIAAETEAKQKAAEEARQKRLQAEAAARYAKMKAQEDAKDAEQRRRIRGGCAIIYKATVDKKVSDLTVRQEQQVRACQALGLYPPS